MTKEKFGQDCKVCLKPFTVFRWCPGRGMRFRRTEVCQTCSRLKNTCQSCLLDLQYGLPVQIRDSVLKIKETCPQNEANREYFLATNAARLARTDAPLIDYEQTDPAARALLESLAKENGERKSAAARSLPNLCSFFAKGACNRGDACPFRHVLGTERPSSLKSYRERYYGTEDPAAADLVERHPELKDAMAPEGSIAANTAPEDRTVQSLFVMGLRDGLDASALQAHFGAESVRMVADGAAAIVSFKTRIEAELAADANLGDSTDINGISVRVSWARSLAKTANNAKRKRTVSSKANPQSNRISQTPNSQTPSAQIPKTGNFFSRHLAELATDKPAPEPRTEPEQ
jgi:pre-mRNA-splicing factor RBM22/SLT11